MRRNWTFRVWGFLAAVYGVSGLLWAPILLSGVGMTSPLNVILMALIAFVPSVMGIVFTCLTQDQAGRRDFWRRATRWPHASLPVTVAALFLMPAMNIGAYILANLLSGQVVNFGYARELLSSLPLLLQFMFVEITFGALSEELGWRGYLLDEMRSRWSPLVSALVLGIFWGAWHTPAFLTPGLAQYEMGGIFSLPYLAFFIVAMMTSILMTWAYYHTGRSILVAGFLMHFMTNVSLTLVSGTFDQFSVPDVFWILEVALFTLAAGAATASWVSETRMKNKVPGKEGQAVFPGIAK